MKYLQDYMSEGTTEIMNRLGAFYAFGQDQFDEAKVDGVKYITNGSGLLCPKANYKQLQEELNQNYKNALKQDIEENSIKKIILRELTNYECFYDGDLSECLKSLKDYGVSEDQVIKVYHKNKDKFEY